MLAPYLGSGTTLRGFANRRFTDRNRVLLTGEYRWRPSRYLDMALFIDAGQVAPDRRDFDLDAVRVAWGIGARFHGPTSTRCASSGARPRRAPAGLRRIAAILMMQTWDSRPRPWHRRRCAAIVASPFRR